MMFLIEGKMYTHRVIVIGIRVEGALQMRFAQNNHVVEALPPD